MFNTLIKISDSLYSHHKLKDINNYHRFLWKGFEEPLGTPCPFRFEINNGYVLISSVKRPIKRGIFTFAEIIEYDENKLSENSYMFKIDINPVIKTRRPNGKQSKKPLRKEADILSWFSNRAIKNGFEVDISEVDIVKSRDEYQSERGKIFIASLYGKLKVVDREKFINAIRKGIGPSPTFGCGALFIKKFKPSI